MRRTAPALLRLGQMPRVIGAKTRQMRLAKAGGRSEALAVWRLYHMMSNFGRFLFAGLLLSTGAAVAQESTNVVDVKSDWSVFTDDNPKECWGVTAPKSSVATRDGTEVTVRRGEVQFFVTYRPGAGAAGEISMTGGYPFADGSTVTVEIDGQSFDLFTDAEWAWSASPEADAALLAAMKKGAEAVVTGRSGRGTQTKDTFSLRGFTAAVEEAEKRCK